MFPSDTNSKLPERMTKEFLPLLCLVASALILPGESFSPDLSRRQVFTNALGTGAGGFAALVAIPQLVNAEVSEETPRVTTRMGGLLVGDFCTVSM